MLFRSPTTPLSPLPYHTANGKTASAVIVILRVDTRRARTQVVTVGSRTSSSRPPVTTRDAFVDVAIRARVVARTEKVERISYHSFLMLILDNLSSEQQDLVYATNAYDSAGGRRPRGRRPKVLTPCGQRDRM